MLVIARSVARCSGNEDNLSIGGERSGAREKQGVQDEEPSEQRAGHAGTLHIVPVFGEPRNTVHIGVGGIAMNWVEDIVEFQHDSLPLAVLGAFVQAQLQKANGTAPSNVTPFRRMDLTPSTAEVADSHPTGR